jgi:lipoprotein NlpD
MGSPPPDQPGFYTVRQGDTLIRIGLDQGQNWRDLARWNNLDNPNSLEVGQQLRVQAPTTSVQSSAAVPSYSSDSQNPGVIVQPVTSTVIVPPASTALSSATSAPAGAPNPTSPRPSAVATPSAMPPALEGGDELSFAWPSHGNVISYFDENKTLKGLDIGGKTGDAVLAAADGKVVYAGNGLRGYGNLVILKHNNTYLSAYAHNQTLLVKEDQSVKRGQKIAEMGSTDSEQVNLHFEIRKLGKPVDPLKFLPPH